ncbi:MAG: PIN domain-containing protein [Deinococcus sp.]|nr:PIN domain-containing protein [Deinococcus sp.]
MRLDQIPSGSTLFVDSSIFIYHFTGASADCRSFLERCERGNVRGVTSVIVLAEVAHRLMMIEALARGLVPPGNLARKLREKPKIVRQLHLYQEQVEQIPLMGFQVLSLELGSLIRSAELRRRYGLLTHDALVATAALEAGLTAIASADQDFERLPDVRLFCPADLV